MKTGIIVHSHTGNTLAVAQKLMESLEAAGHSAQIERVIARNEDPNNPNVELEGIPDISGYDKLIFCAPVRAFSLSPAMNLYLSQLNSLKGKKVGCFVTQQFPFTWMGGKRAVGQMRKICASKHAEDVTTSIVNWSNKKREQMIQDTIRIMSGS